MRSPAGERCSVRRGSTSERGIPRYQGLVGELGLCTVRSERATMAGPSVVFRVSRSHDGERHRRRTQGDARIIDCCGRAKWLLLMCPATVSLRPHDKHRATLRISLVKEPYGVTGVAVEGLNPRIGSSGTPGGATFRTRVARRRHGCWSS